MITNNNVLKELVQRKNWSVKEKVRSSLDSDIRIKQYKFTNNIIVYYAHETSFSAVIYF